MNKKILKLKRHPKLFFTDAILNFLNKPSAMRAALAASGLTKVSNGNFQYVVVSAVYDVEQYLDLYFRSLVRQSLDFKNNVRLVLVDDGSTDQSALIIKRWQERYPENITYLYKKNSGQASARNLGLAHVEEHYDNVDYITFIDPDDFVDVNYFRSVDKFAMSNGTKERLAMMSSNYIIYLEKNGTYSDKHPLNYRFKNGNIVVPIESMGANIQLSVNSAFFSHKLILHHRIRFDERVRPTFEDANFVGQFLLKNRYRNVAFISDAKYYYRKRSDQKSTLDSAKFNKGQFLDVLKFGCLGLIEISLNAGFPSPPPFIQRTILYHLGNYFTWQSIIDMPQKVAFLSEVEREEFFNLLTRILSHVDTDVIMEFELAKFQFFHKVGVLHCFKGARPTSQIVYIEDYDPSLNRVELRYFTGEPCDEKFSVDGEQVTPHLTKTIRHEFLDRNFTHERRIWISLPSYDSTSLLSADLADANGVRLFSGPTDNLDFINVVDIHETHQETKNLKCNSDVWLLMDRDTQADDNAEYLYRHLRDKHPNKKIVFALRKDSKDWGRLENERFNLVAFGTARHKRYLRKCSKIISSHLDRYVVDYFHDGSLKNKRFIFLQHGVTKDDQSQWFNSRKIDCIVTSSIFEYQDIIKNGSKYKFTEENVALTGMPRHDFLLKRQKISRPENIILVMPTWRSYLVGEVKHGSFRKENKHFMESDFAANWQSLLSSEALRLVSERFGYRVVFFPHPNLTPYLNEFDLPSHVEIESLMGKSMQDLFCRAKVMITDFSSVAFEMALLKKEVLYFQFDQEEFWHSHIFQKGYFDYERDGFGPLCPDEGSLLESLEKLLERGCEPEPRYLERMENFFAFRDGENCERVYRAICALDHPASPPDIAAGASQAHLSGDTRECAPAETHRRNILSLSEEIPSGNARGISQRRFVHALKKQYANILYNFAEGPRGLPSPNSTRVQKCNLEENTSVRIPKNTYE